MDFSPWRGSFGRTLHIKIKKDLNICHFLKKTWIFPPGGQALVELKESKESK